MSSIMDRNAAEFWWNKVGKKNIEIPRNVAYYSRNSAYEPWQVTTWGDIHKKRTEKTKANIERKRRHEVVRPCFIWVFYNRHFPYSGWWIYAKTLKNDHPINFRKGPHYKKRLIEKIMTLYPLGVLPLEDNFYQWAEKFSESYPCKAFKRTSKQGLAKAYAKLDKYGNLLDIINIEL